jgi:colicin import membrane protein
MQRVSDRGISITLSVLLHAALVAALVYGWLLYRRPPRPAPTLAIEATAVDARAMRAVPPAPPPPAPPPAQPEPQESVGPPQPTPEERAQREQQRQQEQAAAEQKAADERAAKEAEAKREAEARAQAERKAHEAAEAQKRAAEERQKKEQAREDSEREADLKRSLAAEQASNARSGPELANWVAQITARIQRAWLRPPTARQGIHCVLYVTQVPGGEVTKVTIGECNGDQAVRESIEVAVYRASPLPPPPDPSLFDRDLKIDFSPAD